MPQQRHRGTGPQPSTYDSWLRQYYGELLETLDVRCRDDSKPDYGWFRDLDDELWAILLTKHYSLYPNLRRALPDLPKPAMQERFNGSSGVRLATSSTDFYRRLKSLYGNHGPRPLHESQVLDFGCGWGRLTRYLARDVAPGNLFGCDPNPEVLALCEQTRVPARLARSEEVPSSLPFRERFDLIYAYSVFTHLSEDAHESCLRAIYDGLERSGIMIVTVRPAAFITEVPAGQRLAPDGKMSALLGDAPTYAFAPHAGGPLERGTFGEAVINLPYIRERWDHLFSLLEVTLQMDNIYQVVVTLRRRDAPE
ncbi:MAG: class I SAM-dependent methyltransferase [Actinomycetota bacterium]